MTASTNLTQIIQNWQAGDKLAEQQLYQFAYANLHHLAQKERKRSAEKFGEENQVISDSIQSTTALIHEAYLKLNEVDPELITKRKEFYLMAAKLMRQILVDHARSQMAVKRQVSSGAKEPLSVHLPNGHHFEQLISVDKAMEKLSERYPRQHQALQLKYMMGMSLAEISDVLDHSTSLIEKDLKFGKVWLENKLN